MRTPLFLLVLSACNTPVAADSAPPTADTGGEEPQVLPIDTSEFIPEDTSADGPPNITPDNYVYMTQIGQWNLSSSSPPYSDLSGSFRIVEYIDTLDTALPVYECNVVYALTGSAVENHTCANCDFVFDVEYYVNSGDPATCHDPDAPQSGAILQLGFVEGEGAIYHNYYGTDVWLPWYDAEKNGSSVAFEWAATLAIELVDSGEDR